MVEDFIFKGSDNSSWGFPGGSAVKKLPANTGDVGSIPGSGRSPGGGNGNPLQYSCLGNPTDRGAWQTTVHGVARTDHDLRTKPPPPRSGRAGSSQSPPAADAPPMYPVLF